MRLFIAAIFEEDISEQLTPTIGSLKKLGLDARFPSPEETHLTLKFLGKTSKEKVHVIVEILKKIASQQQPFNVEFSGVTALPKIGFIRVIAVKSDSKRLVKLMEKLSKNLKSEKGNSILPHVTIARISSSRNKEGLIEFIKKRSGKEISKNKVMGFSLFKSTLTQEGPVHERIEEFLFPV